MPIPDFVLALRSHVGNDLLWMPGVSAVVIHRDGRLLLGRRADNGLWAVVSGILEPGEQPALAVVREVLEETGIHAVVEGLAAVSSSPEAVQYENGDRAQYLDLTFLCRAVGTDDPRVADDESTAVGWFEADALPAPMMTSSQARIAHALAYRAHPENGTWFARPADRSARSGPACWRCATSVWSLTTLATSGLGFCRANRAVPFSAKY